LTRFVTAVLTLSLCALGLVSQVAAAPNERALPMRFELRAEGPAGDCADECRNWISAAGAITAETPREFLRFIDGRDLRNAMVVLDSDGGSVLGAIALGREIRRLGLSTSVGRVSVSGAEKENIIISSRADCESMCAFVLLAGVQRKVPAGARVMVHQIWLGDRREDPAAANYSAEDLALVQRDVGRLVRYTADMGGPMEMIELALRIPPWEPMRSLSRDDIRRMKLDTFEAEERAPPAVATAPAPAAPAAPATPSAPAIPAVTSGLKVSALSEAAWNLVENPDGNMLMRRHALTFEGDEIGSFDVRVGCGNNDTYRMTYAERRRSGDGAKPIESVTVRVGRNTIVLPVVTSERRTPAGELETLAAGPVPAALIDAFAASGPHSMMLTTRGGGDFATAIRLGNTGARRNLPQLAQSCKTPGVRADLRAPKTGGVAVRQ